METSGFRLYIYPDELRAGIIELDKWLDYYARDVRGHLARALVTMIQKFRPALPSDTVPKAPRRIVRGIKAVIDRYGYAPSVRQCVINIAEALVTEELAKSTRRARSYLQVFQDVTAAFRRRQIFPRTLNNAEIVPSTPLSDESLHTANANGGVIVGVPEYSDSPSIWRCRDQVFRKECSGGQNP